jgi:predicted ATP-dependent serine protease
MIRPRADIVDADLDRIVLLDENDSRLTLTDDRLERVIIQENIALAIIDPVQAHLPKGVSMNNAESIRPVFTQLAGIAERTNCAIVLVGHVNKGSSTASDRLLGME